MQKLDVYQSLWAMEQRHPTRPERSLEENFAMVAEAGYDGICIDLGSADFATVRRAGPLFAKHGLGCLINAFPKSLEGLPPVLDLAKEFDAVFVNIIGQVMPLRVEEAAPVVRTWIEQSEKAGVPILFETHRNCITNDLFFTLLLMDEVPEMRLCADLSHFVVDREFVLPLPEADKGYISRILDRSDSFQGRFASREQIQIQPSFPQHRKWVDLFLNWWEEGFRKWRARAAPDARLNFLCELGPREYAMTGADNEELSDRWQDALYIREQVQAIWKRLEAEG